MPWYAEREDDPAPEAVRFREARDAARKVLATALVALVQAGETDTELLRYLAEHADMSDKTKGDT